MPRRILTGVSLTAPANRFPAASTLQEPSLVDPQEERFSRDFDDIMERVQHLLPSQGPLTTFVHHNTLHAFQHHSFSEAVKLGQTWFQAEPYWPESRYQAEWQRGRINPTDLRNALEQKFGPGDNELNHPIGSLNALRMALMLHVVPIANGPELHWYRQSQGADQHFLPGLPAANRESLSHETQEWLFAIANEGWSATRIDGHLAANEAFRRFVERLAHSNSQNRGTRHREACTLALLDVVCRMGVQQVTRLPIAPSPPTRLRDWLWQESGIDTDEWVNELLIKFTAAYLDQGFSAVPLPERDRGYWGAFCALMQPAYRSSAAWRRLLPAALQSIQSRQLTTPQIIYENLVGSGYRPEEFESVIARELLSLRGFAGMLGQASPANDRVHYPVPANSVAEYLAVRLLLQRLAGEYLARRHWGCSLEALLRRRPGTSGVGAVSEDSEFLAFTIFQLAQWRNWSPRGLAGLSAAGWQDLSTSIEQFSSFERREVWQLAYEANYSNRALNALLALRAAKSHEPAATATSIPFQLVTCIDDREESFRRHVEELEPACETYGIAGFFAVPMYFRGLADAHFTPLCPVVVKPQHYVQEEVAFSLRKEAEARRQRRQKLGQFSRSIHWSSRALTGGSIGTSLLGSLATIPLVARVIAPRLTSRWRDQWDRWIRPPQHTELRIERLQDPPGPEEPNWGFRVDEMAQAVARFLEDIGLTRRFAPLVLVAGHGSSSWNNPHESAYNCGACAGARGGPNARAFAQMANDPRVRAKLEERGICIPIGTFFVGLYHNTCNDDLEFFDLDNVPFTHRQLLAETLDTLDQARARNAHERSRRFESADPQASIASALRHVEGRAQDLSQARPEYNHATNALCFVGRRFWSRQLFLDRRAFLVSYDPSSDGPEQPILSRILQAALPVCAGISLEYYFSTVDPERYGCGNKLPHNITSLLGVMTGAESDLRPGLSQQMVEIHEPMRLLFVIESPPAALLSLCQRNPEIQELVSGNWVQLASYAPTSGELWLYRHGKFESFAADPQPLVEVSHSGEWYQGQREHLDFARIVPVPAHPTRSAEGPIQ